MYIINLLKIVYVLSSEKKDKIIKIVYFLLLEKMNINQIVLRTIYKTFHTN